MSDDEDNRISCKYGADCYQQNPTHRQKYKHPKKRVVSIFHNYLNTFIGYI